MANYATLEQLKSYLHITGSEEDTVLSLCLNASTDKMNQVIGVDTFLESTVTSRIIPDLSKQENRYILEKFKVTSIDKINWITYTGTLEEDYIIEKWRIVTINDLADYIGDTDFSSVSIEYTAGYSEAPGDVIMINILIASLLYQESRGGGALESYTAGDEKVVFRNPGDQKLYSAFLKSYRMA